MPLLDIFHVDPVKDAKNLIYLVFSITNIVKGDIANKRYFFEQRGLSRFLQYTLEASLKQPQHAPHDLKLIDLCLESVREVAACKQIIHGLISTQEGLLL
jgi:hypothetical protein